MKILAVDPGNIQSGYVVMDSKTYKPLEFGKIFNDELLLKIKLHETKCYYMAIEMVACYGMPAGASLFDTCVWIGRFIEAFDQGNENVYEQIYRKDVKMNLCGQMRARDSNVTQALIDRFAPNTRNHGKGIKKDPGFFYGFKADIWQAYAVGVTYLDNKS